MNRPSANDRRHFWPTTLLMLVVTATVLAFVNYASFGIEVSVPGFLRSLPVMLQHEPQLLVLILACFLLMWWPYALITLGAVGPRERTAVGTEGTGPSTSGSGVALSARTGTDGADPSEPPRSTVVVHTDPIAGMTPEERGQAAQVLGIPWRTELRYDDQAWDAAYESALEHLGSRHPGAGA